ncbi:MAG: hypothetical protein N2490_06735 [Ignavibacteria bacterium]|nr:hypothetical protein [Ignavibacteria bacterium]
MFTIFYLNSFSQINVYEKPIEKDIPYRGLISKTKTRYILDLNGQWSLSINDGKNFTPINVPSTIDYKGKLLLKRYFNLNDAALKNFFFILVAEGISYESEIHINRTFVSKNLYGFASIITPLDENILNNSNEIVITLSSDLSYINSIPLKDQINYGKINAGITQDIYIVAVPKLFILETKPDIKLESENYARITNKISLLAGNIAKYKEGGNLYLKTSIFKPEDIENPISESNMLRVNISDYQHLNNLINELSIRNPNIWKPSNPKLYIIKTTLYQENEVIDEFIDEFGINDIKFSASKKSFVNLAGEPIKIIGINYFAESSHYNNVITYKNIEKDILLIKDLGFNCIRVPGKPAHPYIIDACKRNGLYIFNEIPFNEVPSKILSKTEYIKNATEYIESIIKRDKSAPCIIAWGVGNDFDVTEEISQTYLIKAREAISKYDSRPVYYTTSNIEDDICLELSDLRGINIRTYNISKLEEISEKFKKINTPNNPPLFVSHIGVPIENNNKNGYNDKHSVEYQTKFLVESYNLFVKNYPCIFISSFSDWFSQRPLNYPLSENYYLNTNGILDLERNQKLSAVFLKRLNYDQSLSKISEGSSENILKDKSFIIIIFGVLVAIFFSFLYTRLPRFKESVSRSFSSLTRSVNFFQYAKEQNILSVNYDIIFALILSSSVSVYLTSILYFYKENPYLDMLISNLVSSDNLKILLSYYFTNPLLSIIFLIIIFLILIVLVTFILTVITVIMKHRYNFKNIFAVTVWSLYPYLIFLPIGIIIYKLGTLSTVYITLSLVLFLVCYILSILRLISGFKFMFEHHFGRAFLYGLIFYFITAGGLLVYLYFYKNTLSILNLILSYNI